MEIFIFRWDAAYRFQWSCTGIQYVMYAPAAEKHYWISISLKTFSFKIKHLFTTEDSKLNPQDSFYAFVEKNM